ncbi:Nitrogen permease regulator 3 [Coemansia sp. RSA 988]|nr:Nitrogen permease regulator 3 [Coemansia sp. RSA 988]
MTHDGDAILGIFLATYSSKGDYLPLRYPLSEFDYEYAEALLKAQVNKRMTRAERSGGSSNSFPEAACQEPQVGTDNSAMDSQSAKKEYMPSRNGSCSSITNAGSNPQTPKPQQQQQPPGSQTQAPSMETALQTKGLGRNECKPPRSSPSARGSEGRLSTDRQFPSGIGTTAGQEPYMAQLVHGFEAKLLAQLFSPRPSMSDQRFQVAINNVLFVGHPVRDDPNEKTRDPDYYDAEQDDKEAMVRLAENEGWKVKSNSTLQPGAREHGTRLLADLGLVNLILNRDPSESEDGIISDGERAVRESGEWMKRGYQNRVYPKLFHIVFMLDNTISGIESLADRIYDHVLKRLTKTLMIEQTETNYVLTQSRLIRTLNDVALSGGYTSAQYLHEVMRCSDLATNLIELYNGLRKGELVNLHVHKRLMLSLQIPRGPRLERPLPETRPRVALDVGHDTLGHYSERLKGTSTNASALHTPRPDTPTDGSATFGSASGRAAAPTAHEYLEPLIFLRDAVGSLHGNESNGANIVRGSAAHRSMPHHLFAPESNMASHGSQDIVITGREIRSGENSGFPHIEPYHAVLLLEDVERLRRRLLYADASPTLLTIIEKASPTRPLVVLHTMVDCSFAQLCRFVSHLVYWNIARLICPVNLAFTYVPICESLERTLLDKFSAQSYSLCTLPQLLARMHPPRPATQVLDSLINIPASAGTRNDEFEESEASSLGYKSEFRDMLVFLLRESAIAQYHTWPVILVPSYVKYDLDEEQFINMALSWFRGLHAEHPDLLGGFPQTLMNHSELEQWVTDGCREQASIDLINLETHEAEDRVMLSRVMRKLALSRVREKWAHKQRGKDGEELERISQQATEEEDKVRAFCDRIEKDNAEAWMHTKAQHDAVRTQARQNRIRERRAHGVDVPDGEAEADDEGTLCRWYSFVKKGPDVAEFANEIVSKYVTHVPIDGSPHRTDAERRYIHLLVQGRPNNQQDWFHRHCHLFTGNNHLVKLMNGEQMSTARLEAVLQEFDGIVLLPQHI